MDSRTRKTANPTITNPDAIQAGASDIHFEPYERYYRIRYRLDGILMEVAQPPLAIKEKIAKESAKTGKRISDLLREKNLLPEEKIAEIFTPEFLAGQADRRHE